MSKEKKSFFEKLTGTVRLEEPREKKAGSKIKDEDNEEEKDSNWMEEEAGEGQLTVDVYQSANEIVIKTMVAGVKPEDLDINITRDMVTIKGRREGERGISAENYFFQELYWGSFSRTILLPQEIQPEEAEAIEKHGLLIIRMPKVNKDRQTKLKVKTI